MSNYQNYQQDHQQLVPQSNDDGWGDASREAAERTIRGTLLKFSDWRWLAGKEAKPVATGTQLLALGTVAMWVRWHKNKPVEYRVRQPGQRLPEREALGWDDPAEWETDDNGVPIDPWRNTRLVYLVDPKTAEAYTFATSSFGGRGAVADLGDNITRMRLLHPEAVPLVSLEAAEMRTRYGVKSKPVFRIVSWRTGDTAAPPTPVAPAPAAGMITAKEAEKELSDTEMDDAIPF